MKKRQKKLDPETKALSYALNLSRGPWSYPKLLILP